MSLLEEAENTSFNNCIRIAVMGSIRVGKTAIVKRFLAGGVAQDGAVDEDDIMALSFFSLTYTPTIEAFHRKIYKIRSEYYKLDILDTAGTDPFPAMRRLNILAGTNHFFDIRYN